MNLKIAIKIVQKNIERDINLARDLHDACLLSNKVFQQDTRAALMFWSGVKEGNQSALNHLQRLENLLK